MDKIELLAPAKNLECGIAAIDHGADAVYIGAQRFGARVAAGNSVEDIAQLCTYAHQFGAKVYVTVNTIIYDEELEDTQRLLQDLQAANVDAILVQDMGLLSIVRSAFPLRYAKNCQLSVVYINFGMSSLLQVTEEELAHEEGLELLGDDTIHFAGTIFAREPFFQQQGEGRIGKGHGDVLGGELLLQLA